LQIDKVNIESVTPQTLHLKKS